MLRGRRWIGALLVGALALLGCRGAAPAGEPVVLVTPAPATEAPTPTATPTATPAPVTVPPQTPAPTPTLAPTPEPTATPTPTPEPTPTPVPTPSGLCGGRYPDKFTEDVYITEASYQSPELAIFLNTVRDEDSFSSFVTYFIADIYVQDITLLRTAAAGADFTSTGAGSVKQMAKRNNALFAASGDYYAHSLRMGRTPLIIRNGVLYKQKVTAAYESCVLFRDGTMAVYAPEDLDPQALMDAGAWQGWTFGPALLDENGQPRTNIPKKYVGVNDLNPRCMLGYYEPGHYCLVVVDGRQRAGRYSMGLTLRELGQLAYDLGCAQAYNLDGGQSAQFYWQGKIFNHPTGGGRTISDILYFAAPEA